MSLGLRKQIEKVDMLEGLDKVPEPIIFAFEYFRRVVPILQVNRQFRL
jgi:hypothetical protein